MMKLRSLSVITETIIFVNANNSRMDYKANNM